MEQWQPAECSARERKVQQNGHGVLTILVCAFTRVFLCFLPRYALIRRILNNTSVLRALLVDKSMTGKL